MSAPELPVKLTVGGTSHVVGWVDETNTSGQVVADIAALLREAATAMETEHARAAQDRL